MIAPPDAVILSVAPDPEPDDVPLVRVPLLRV